MTISPKDLARIRALARRQRELAQCDKMRVLKREWAAHGRFETGTRPMVSVELGSFASDILPPLLQCEGERAREIERALLSNVLNFEGFGDDTPVDDFVRVVIPSNFVAFSLPEQIERASNGGIGYHFIPRITDLEEDFSLLGRSSFSADAQAARARADFLSEVLDGILPVRIVGPALDASLTYYVVRLMGLENLYIALCDAPERFQEMLDMLARDHIAYYDMLGREGLLTATAESEPLRWGSFCYTGELGGETPQSVKAMWGHMNSQEASGISPAMFRELVLPAYKRVAECFGLLSYGCCEAVDGIWEGGLSTIKNLRKVSISPWCNEEYMGEVLGGREIVYLRKPSPNLLGVGGALEEEAVLKHIGRTARAAKGCHLEIAQRDVYQVGGSIDKVRRYVELMRRAVG